MAEKRRLKIGLALGSGGAKGLAHIGCLKVLEEYGIKPDMITGTSMGAIIGAGYALGYNAKELESVARESFVGSDIYSFDNFHFFHEGLLSRELIEPMYFSMVGNKNFEDCKIPFMALACDLESGQEVHLTKGRLLDAIQASSAIPVVFPPVFIDGRYMVDGAMINPTPVDYLRRHGMDMIIGVHNADPVCRQFISGLVWDKNYRKPDQLKKEKKGKLEQIKMNIKVIFEVLMRVVEITQEANLHAVFIGARPDVVIEPDTTDFSVTNFDKLESVVNSGEEAMRKKIESIFKVIEHKKKDLGI
ncbi:hypothetical protein C0416_02470 [bacterium]|nr:hypothetical protein [bacterium]